MTTTVKTLRHEDITSLTTSLSTMRFLAEIMLIFRHSALQNFCYNIQFIVLFVYIYSDKLSSSGKLNLIILWSWSLEACSSLLWANASTMSLLKH